MPVSVAMRSVREASSSFGNVLDPGKHSVNIAIKGRQKLGSYQSLQLLVGGLDARSKMVDHLTPFITETDELTAKILGVGMTVDQIRLLQQPQHARQARRQNLCLIGQLGGTQVALIVQDPQDTPLLLSEPGFIENRTKTSH